MFYVMYVVINFEENLIEVIVEFILIFFVFF